MSCQQSLAVRSIARSPRCTVKDSRSKTRSPTTSSRVGRQSPAAANQRLDSRQELINIKRLSQVVVPAQAQPLDLVFGGIHGGQNEDRRSYPPCPQLLTDREARHVGDRYVQQNQVERMCTGQIETFPTRVRHRDRIALGTQPPRQEVGHPRLIFHHQQAHAATRNRPTIGRLRAGDDGVTDRPRSERRSRRRAPPRSPSPRAGPVPAPRHAPPGRCSRDRPHRRTRSSSSGGMPTPLFRTCTITPRRSEPIRTLTSLPARE